MPDDRLTSEEAEKKLPKPEVYIVRNGDAVFKPGLKSWFVEARGNSGSGEQSGNQTEDSETSVSVGGTVCTCNKVCTCEAVCTCQNHKICTCNKVCTCQSHQTCTCNKVCSCLTYRVCSCNSQTRCTCNPYCTCHPVH